MVSTDKAVDPSSIMGASKRIAELILLASHHQTRMKIVRLGNVLGSSGSVVPLFLRQIARGGPVTVSHPEVRRYFMTLTEAVDNLLFALGSDSLTGLTVPELGDPIRILDLARFLIGPASEHIRSSSPNFVPETRWKSPCISTRESYRGTINAPLRVVHTPTPSPEELSASLDTLRKALQQRDLPALLQTVQYLVPEYHPSPSLAAHLQTSPVAAVTA